MPTALALLFLATPTILKNRYLTISLPELYRLHLKREPGVQVSLLPPYKPDSEGCGREGKGVKLVCSMRLLLLDGIYEAYHLSYIFYTLSSFSFPYAI